MSEKHKTVGSGIVIRPFSDGTVHNSNYFYPYYESESGAKIPMNTSRITPKQYTTDELIREFIATQSSLPINKYRIENSFIISHFETDDIKWSRSFYPFEDYQTFLFNKLNSK
ncbi:MAG: hypothetical protein ABI241_00415 [Bacteroidia bacterium]